MNAIEQLKSVLCDPEGKCCITGSDEDRAIVDRALQALAASTVQEVVPEGVIAAIRHEGLTLVKDLQGYRLMRLGKVEAQAIPPAHPAPVQEPVKWSDYEPDGRRYPAVPDAIHHTDLSEHPQYIEGWNDCRAEMLKGMKP